MPGSARAQGEDRGPRVAGGEIQQAAVVAVLTLLGLLLVLFLIYLLRELIAAALLGIVLGTTLAPAADFLARFRIPRILTGVVVYGLIAILIGVFFWYAVPGLIDEARALGDTWDDLESDYNTFADGSFLPESETVLEFARENLAGFGPEAVGQAFAVINGFVLTLTVLAVGLFWTITRISATALFLSLLSDAQRKRAEPVLELLGRRLRRFVVAEFLSMLSVGVLTFIGLTILGVPFALVLAVIAFLFEILPFAGPWIAFVPAFGVALTQSWEMAIAVSVFYLIVQQLESYVIVPYLHGREMKMPELVIFLSVLGGATLMGILGALVAIPVAVIAHTLFMELFVPWRRERVGSPRVMLVPEEVEAPPRAPPPLSAGRRVRARERRG